MPRKQSRGRQSRQAISLRRGIPEADMELAQLLLGRERGGAGDKVLAALRLREGDDVTDRVRPRHERHHAVEAEGDAAVRRRAELERVEQEAELGLLLLLA